MSSNENVSGSPITSPLVENQGLTPKSYQCHACNRRFAHRQGLNRHRSLKRCPSTKSVTPTSQKQHTSTKSEANSQNQQRRTYFCPACGRQYYHKSSLTRHKKQCMLMAPKSSTAIANAPEPSLMVSTIFSTDAAVDVLMPHISLSDLQLSTVKTAPCSASQSEVERDAQVDDVHTSALEYNVLLTISV